MSKVTVHFFGICTHTTLHPEIDGMSHRVIFVNAQQSQIDRHFDTELDLKPHITRLQILNSDLAGAPPDEPWCRLVHGASETATVWQLDGASLRIAGATVPPGASGGEGCIPSLSGYCKPPIPSLLPQNVGNISVADRELTSCFFDFPGITPAGYDFPGPPEPETGGAAVAAVTVEVSGTVAIEVRQFGTGDAQPPARIEIRGNSPVTVSNYPENPGPGDKDDDFFLHFLALQEIPAQMWSPPQRPWRPCSQPLVTDNPPVGVKPTSGFTGPGCSNSIYP